MPRVIADRKSHRDRLRTASCEHPRRYPGEPTRYMDWFDWAERMSETYEQKLCPHCGLWAIWEPRDG